MEKISIIIPVYNGSDYLSEAIDSALSQEYSNYEIIVINDGSNDNGATEQIALSYGDKIKYIYKENGGVSSALNLGIKKMKGEYFSWLSHDDKYTPYKLKNLANLLNLYENSKTVAISGVTYINDKSNKVRDVKYHLRENKLYSGIEVIDYLLKYGTLNGCAMLIPKKAFEEFMKA